MAYRRKLKNKKPPEGWELIEEVIEEFEGQMKEAVNEEHEGRRKNELAWKIHRIHWEKNRFIFDLMYQRKVMSKELVSNCSCSPSNLYTHSIVRGLQYNVSGNCCSSNMIHACSLTTLSERK